MARELEPERFGGAHAAALVEVVAQGERVCAAMKALLARRVDECGVWRADGSRTAGHWLAEKTGVTVGAATQALQTARRLDELPATAEAFRAGSLSELQAHEITMAAGADRTAEARLLGAARETGVQGLRDRCREVRVGAEDNDAAWARRLHDSRYAHDWSDPDGAYRVDARMPPEDGARFRSAWYAHIDRIFREARRAGRHEPRAAYAADALVALATDGPCRPVDLRVTVDESALRRGIVGPGERCEMPGLGAIPVTTARRLYGDAVVTTVIRDGSDIAAVSRRTRTIPARLRRSLETRYPTCGVKRCANDRFLEIDHVIPLGDGGRTEQRNLWRICSHHHALKTYAGWRVTGPIHDWDLVPPSPADGAGQGRDPP